MLNSLYQNILAKLKEEFNEFELTDTNFGFTNPDKVYPFFSIEGQEFKLKTPQFKKAANKVKKHELTNELIVPSASVRKKGPYVLESPPVEITSILVVKKPGTSDESVTNLGTNEYSIDDNLLNLKNSYTDGTKVMVSYTSFGELYTDRFEQQFAIKIYEKDQAKLEKYSVLTLSAIWAGIGEMMSEKYRFATGNTEAHFDLSELSFLGQSNQYDEVSISILNFMVSGTAVFVKTKTDGFHLIKEVLIGEKESTVIDEHGGVSIGLIKNSAE